MKAVLLVLMLAVPLIPTGGAASCTPDHVWFLGVVDDSAERDDFKQDVLNFEFFLDELRDVYCIPDAQAEILAFDGAFTHGSTSYSYAEASEENLKDRLQDMGTEASKHTDSTFFYFHSSHGMVYTAGLSTCPLLRTYGSYAALHSTGPEDGYLDDCELGSELNTHFDDDVRMLIAVDCSFCGGFSDSLTALSGTLPDGAPVSSGVPGDERIVITGCAMTTECFGGGIHGGAVMYDYLREILTRPVSACDGWTAPAFPTYQGADVPVKNALLRPLDGTCTASEWFFAAIDQAYKPPIVITTDLIGIQQQFRIKYGSSVTDIQIA